jgi:protein ImuB
MRLWIAVHLSRLPLEAFFPKHAPDPGCAVLDHDRVMAVSTSAWQAGIRKGMRRGGVLMLAPDTAILDRDVAREQEFVYAAAMALLQYTPQVAPSDESTLLMDVGASLTLFNGAHALCRRIRADMRALGFTASLGCAPTARGAWLLARHGRGHARTVQMHTLQRRLDQLPALLLPPARRFAEWLEGIGCATIAELRRLPRPGLQRRCGRDLLDVLDAAYDMVPEAHDWIEPPETFRTQIEIFGRVEKADELLAGVERLILQMLGWLSARQLAVQGIVLEMAHERGRVARPPSTLEITLAEPVWRGDHLVRLLKERLASQALDAPVIGLALEAVDVVPMEPPSESLFPDPKRGESDQLQLIEVLTARLGAESVLRSDPQADYRPEVANFWKPVTELVRAADLKAGLPANLDQFPRPTWILAKPIQLLIRDHRPFYGSPLRMVSNPERIEAGWWSEAQSRDYFMAEGKDHTLYWVYRERIAAEDGERHPRWFLHGLFG